MRLSRYYLPLLKETPGDAQIASHRLMLRGGMIRQQAAGIYAWLPLGLRVLQKIERIVREEQERAGAVELLMPTVQPATLWHESGRYDAYGPEMLRFKDRHDRDMLYGPTNEEMITALVRSNVRSYKDLPKLLYHIQWKFRDEVRPRFGVMRGREFLMKDTYSFDLDPEGARRSYLKMFAAYLRTFARLGLKAIPTRADTGPIGGDLSHEFIVLAETGESEVYVHRGLMQLAPPPVDLDFDGDLEPMFTDWTSRYAATDDMHNPAAWDSLNESDRLQARGIEVGHIFNFGTKYSKAMKAAVESPDGQRYLEMGSYGIGVSRLVGAIIEANHDEHGCRWPMSVAPFHCGIVNLKPGEADSDAACDAIYKGLESQGAEVLLDDTADRAGEKFARMDLIGLPAIVTVGPRGLKDDAIEVKWRGAGEKVSMPMTRVVDTVADFVRTGLRID